MVIAGAFARMELHLGRLGPYSKTFRLGWKGLLEQTLMLIGENNK
jgi:hypothetical protein